MESRSHAFIAVTFLLVFSLGAAAIFVWLHRGPKEDRYYDIVSSYAVGGLQPEAAVEFKGLRVGNVKALHFDPNDPSKVIIRIAVYPKAYVTRATYAKLGYRGITGLTYIALANKSGVSPTPLPTNAAHPARIPMRQGLLQSLQAAGTTDLKRISTVLDRLGSVLSEDNQKHLAATLAHLDRASLELAELEKQLSPAVKPLPGIETQARKLLEESRKLAATANRLAARANRPVGEVGAAARSLKRLSDSSDRLVNRLNEDLLPRIETLVRRMNQSVTQIDRLSRQLRSRPQSLIFGPSQRKAGPGEPGFHGPSTGQ